MEREITFTKLHGETEWLIKPIRVDGVRITDEQIDEIVKELNEGVGAVHANAIIESNPEVTCKTVRPK